MTPTRSKGPDVLGDEEGPGSTPGGRHLATHLRVLKAEVLSIAREFASRTRDGAEDGSEFPELGHLMDARLALEEAALDIEDRANRRDAEKGGCLEVR